MEEQVLQKLKAFKDIIQNSFDTVRQNKDNPEEITASRRRNQTDINQLIYHKNYQLKKIKEQELLFMKKQYIRVQLRDFKVQGKSKAIVQQLIKQGKYKPIEQVAIENYSKKIQNQKMHQEQKLANQRGQLFKQPKLKANSKIVESFLQRNNKWCEEVKQRQLQQLQNNLVQEIKKFSPKKNRNSTRPNSGDPSKRSQKYRQKLLQDELQRNPFSPNKHVKKPKQNKVRFGTQFMQLL